MKRRKEKKKKINLSNIEEVLYIIAREITELKLGMIKNGTCKEISQEEFDEYLDENQILKLRCPNGHVIRMSFKEFENGDRCPTCNEIEKEVKK